MILVIALTNLMRNYLHHTDIYLHQRKDMFRMNTDTFLLGEFMDVRAGETVLDIGTNNGALLLYASLHQPGRLIGIDVFDEACQLARSNLSDHGLTSFEIHCVPVQEFACDEVDVIVCNPPYFPSQDQSHVNENEFLRVARHEVRLRLNELGCHVSRLLKEGGRFYLVHRSNRLIDIMKIMDENKLGVQRVAFVYDESRAESTAILVEAVKGYQHNVKIQTPITISRASKG